METRCISALGNVEAFLNGLDTISHELASRLQDLHNVNSVENLPQSIAEASYAAQAAYRAVSDEATTALKELGASFVDAGLDVLLNLVREDKPITDECLAKTTGALPTNSLHQYRYLNPYIFASMVHAASVDTLGDIDINACCCTAPEDMYAVSILKRTYGFTSQSMAEEDSRDYLINSFLVAVDYAAYLEENIRPIVTNIQETLDSDQMKEAAIAALNNPSMEGTINGILDRMIESCNVMSGFAARCRGMVEMYKNLYSALNDTREAIVAAYKIYIDEGCAITF